LKNVISVDETWVYGYDIETKHSPHMEEFCFTSPQESTAGVLMSDSSAACFFD
jgi:hypothetical protein